MRPAASASTSDVAEHLSAALTLAERTLLLRQVEPRSVRQQTDVSRAAGIVNRWKSREPFTVVDHFEKRLCQDGLTEEKLVAILGLSPDVYSELFPILPAWVDDLQRLYARDSHPASDDQEFLQWSREGTNAFLWIANPLIQEGLRRFREAAHRLPATGASFDPATVERLVLPNLLATLKAAVEKVMVLELNVARVRGLLKGELPEERFRSFCDTLLNREVRWSIVREYPVLFRSLHIQTMNWVDYSIELLERLSDDKDLIRENFASAIEPGRLTAISAGAGDSHRGGRTVSFLEFSSGMKLVYKPHSLSLDVHFGEFLEWVNQSGFELPFRIVKIIDRGCYGWSEFIAPQPCVSHSELERFYQRLGGYLAVFYVFTTTDMHFDNLIAAGEFPVPVDLETLFHPIVEEKEDPAAGTWQSSVLRVLLLPTRILASETQEGVDISGLGGKGGQYYPTGRAASWEGTATDEMRLVSDKAVPLKVVANRAKLEERDAAAEEFLEAFVRGFERVYRLIEARCGELEAPRGLLSRFAEDEVRFLGRPTSIYSLLLAKALHPDMTKNAIERDQLFDSLWLSAVGVPYLSRLVRAERKDLHDGDVPVFIARPNSRDLWTSRGERIAEVFEQTAVEGVRRRLHQLGDEDLALQTRFIRTSITSVGEHVHLVSTPRQRQCKLQFSKSRDAIDLAFAVGEALCREAFENDSYASWIGLTPVGSREVSWSLQPLDVSLYGGLAGCSFFLAYLGVLTGDQSFSKTARKSIQLVRRQLERRRRGGLPVRRLGGYSGSGALIYTLAHLGLLWQDAELINEAQTLAADVAYLTEKDRMLDVVNGSAGCIVALAVLNAVRPSDHLLESAVLCGERLLARQQPQHTGSAWQTEVPSSRPLTGFAHGVAGIAWALLKLAAWSEDPRFRTAAESAIAYERSTFVSEEANWPDFRKRYIEPEQDQSQLHFSAGWCHGAPGIALARIDSLPYENDRETREEILIGLHKTVESGFGRDRCLCHGDLGNLDILRSAAEKVDLPGWNEIWKRQAEETLAAITEEGFSCVTGNSVDAPGMMVGLAGIGYGLLRLAYPERVPSVLVLAPPVQI